MKKIIAIILLVFLFSCKNDSEKMDALDFCLLQSENMINNRNKKHLSQMSMDTLNPFATNSLRKRSKLANNAFQLHDDFVKKINRQKNISLSDLNIEFNKYLDTLMAISSDIEYIKSEIGFENYRNMKKYDSKTYSLLSTIFLNEFLRLINNGCRLIIDVSQLRIVPTKDNYKIGDNMQIFFSLENSKTRPTFNFTQFTRNRVPLNLKDLNYDKERRMIDFKIKEKGHYKIKGFELVSMEDCYRNVTDTIPFETEFEVK
jgi:hypothetical protein